MIRLKKMMALVIALVMVICTMNFTIFADNGDLTPDSKITITGLDAGDTVHLYRILEWKDGTGWVLSNSAYSALTDSTSANYVPNVVELIKNHYAADKQPIKLTKEDVEKIAKVVKANKTTVIEDKEISGSPYEYETTQKPGMYIALVTPGTAGVIYNPIVISADFSATPDTSSIDASNARMGIDNISVAKKEKITVTKNAEEVTPSNKDTDKTKGYTHNVGDIVKFTIETKIPAYADSYINPSFTVSDKLSDGLILVVDNADHKFTVESGDVTYTGDPAAQDGKREFKLVFDSAKIAALLDYQTVKITYFAKVTSEAITNIDEEDNTIEVEFSNDPHDDDHKGKAKDKTKHYTFTIDGNLLGRDKYRTGELVKVGVDANGDPVESYRELSNGEKVAALVGAEFGLYKSEQGAKNQDENDLYKNDVFTTGKVTTNEDGLMEINGLDVGEYYLKELTAPKGYIRDPDVHKIEITAEFETKEVTETLNGYEYTYDFQVLKSYTVTIDGNTVDETESTYSTTINASGEVVEVTPGDSTSQIKNTKGVELPATGGMGTTIFYVIGTILVLGAGILLVTRRRMNME